jgi:hypothetical protein
MHRRAFQPGTFTCRRSSDIPGDGKRMRSPIFTALVVLAAGCASQTLTLLPDGADGGRSPDSDARPTESAGGAPSRDCLDPCGSRRPYCEPMTGRCVECTSNDHCGQQEACDPIAHDCAFACRREGDCTREWASHCDGARGVCVECTDDSHCTSPERFCDDVTATCIECRNDRDCSGDRLYCDEEHRCRECLSDNGCPAGERCNSEGYCVSDR